MSFTRTSYTHGQASASSAHESDSYTDDDSFTSQSQDETWAEGYNEVEPSDSASVSADHYGHHRPAARIAPRKHVRPERRPSITYRVAPATQPTMSTDPSDDYYGGANGRYMSPSASPYPYHHPAQSHAGYGQHYNGGHTARGGAMVHYSGFQSNPFAPMPPAAANNYYGEAPRPNYDMVPFQNNYYSAPGPYAMQPVHYMYPTPPAPPPTEAPGPSQTPAPPPEKKPDPEMEFVKRQLEELQLEKKRQEEEIKRKEQEEKLRKEAEIEFQKRMEAARRQQEEQQKELARAKAEAERIARERIEAERRASERKAEEQRQAIARIEAEARIKIERERREEEERRKREAEIAAAAEEKLKAKMEAAEAAAKAKVAAEFKAAAEAREAAEKKIQEEKEWRKRLEEEAKLKAEAAARAKLEEERKKAEAAKAAEEERKRAEKAMRERIVEETKARIEEEAKKSAKAPIRFKDAVGRKFSFPFHLCQTWPGMEELIKQAFVQVEAIGPHVQEGHYDLLGPDGEIILPSIWEKVVQPDWSITMRMWPMEKSPPLRSAMGPNGMPPGAIPVGGIGRNPAGINMVGRGMPIPGRPGMFPPGAGPPRPAMWQQAPPGMVRPGMATHHHNGMGPAHVVNGDAPRHDKKKSSSKSAATFLQFMGGKPAKPAKKRK